METRATQVVGRFLGRAAPFVSLLFLIGLGCQLFRSQAQSEQELIDRFRIRAEIGAQFVSGYTRELLAREGLEAAVELSGDVSEQQFTRFSRALGFPAAVLLDGAGRLLAVEPPSDELLGSNVGSKYAHLEGAMKGRVSVSNVVSSAARGDPIVALAVPVETRHGRRVFSGALSIANTTVGTHYLKSIVPLPSARVYLVDQKAATIASSLVGQQTPDLLRQRELPLAEALALGNEGRYAESDGSRRFALAHVQGTPWRLVVTAPESELLSTLAGGRWLPWAIFAALCLAWCVLIFLSRRLAGSRAAQFAVVEKMSLTDKLTGLYNRRGHELLAAQVLRTAARNKTMVAVLFLDLDGLKHVNDEHGHEAGDRMLLGAADLLRQTFRDTDVIARLGGDEFCIVGATDSSGNRDAMRHRLEENLVCHNASCVNEPPLSFSMGLAWWDSGKPRPLDELVGEADKLMYEDKRSKRTPVNV